ncbi:phosphoglycerate mutase family protein [Microdochium trichocladiopsis]|uniref:Phosphoglycerate mutase family protein n=1 Tax=Microdochium trichocladiopsis TaxID=1682393 RepID=A0A9P9BIB3_9PEZI|nr:phosphoglycerate mutase family protein [Microdochium trichocladiopsis]KAH7021400.1 phosphoglycerate mutase family protein [Microdochium trichocladiopsis]
MSAAIRDSNAPIIYLVRHAESEHNVSKDMSHRDPPLTALGVQQATAIATAFPELGSVATIFTSPLTRAIQTTVAGFSSILHLDGRAEPGGDGGAQLIVDPDLQERSDLACDTGSSRSALEQAFRGLDFSTLNDDNWPTKKGAYAPDDSSVSERAQRFRERLHGVVETLGRNKGDNRQARKNIVVVTHGVFMKFLANDGTIDLPKSGWKAFTLDDNAHDKATLVALD